MDNHLNRNQPAFPDVVDDGLTKLEYAAIQIGATLALREVVSQVEMHSSWAKDAVQFAHALFDALEQDVRDRGSEARDAGPGETPPPSTLDH